MLILGLEENELFYWIFKTYKNRKKRCYKQGWLYCIVGYLRPNHKHGMITWYVMLHVNQPWVSDDGLNGALPWESWVFRSARWTYSWSHGAWSMSGYHGYCMRWKTRSSRWTRWWCSPGRLSSSEAPSGGPSWPPGAAPRPAGAPADGCHLQGKRA